VEIYESKVVRIGNYLGYGFWVEIGLPGLRGAFFSGFPAFQIARKIALS